MLPISQYFKVSSFKIQIEMIEKTTNECMTEPYTVFAVCFSLFWGFNTLAHCIFVMKYWVLSFKMQQITGGAEVKHLETRAKVLFYF